MPEYTSLPRSGNTNNNLKSLKVGNYELSPSFDEDIIEYEVFVPLETDKVNVEAEVKVATSTLTGTGEYELTDDETQITITVTNEVLQEKKYTITIKKIEIKLTIDDIVTNSGYKIIDNFIYRIKNGTKASDIKNVLITNGAKNVVIKNQENNVLKDNDTLSTTNVIEISDGNEAKTFTLSIIGDVSGDGKITILDLLQVQKHIKGVKKLSGASLLAGDTSLDNKVTILDLLKIQKHIKGAIKL
jgi:hypothetical protein